MVGAATWGAITGTRVGLTARRLRSVWQRKSQKTEPSWGNGGLEDSGIQADSGAGVSRGTERDGSGS